MKKIVQRTCTGCNTKKDKKELIRIVINNDEILVDETGNCQAEVHIYVII